MKVGIIIITYNAHELLLKQVERIKLHCKDESANVIIIDNSTRQESIDAIKYYCGKLGLTYVKTKAASLNGSGSHAFAANLSYTMFKETYTHFLYLDHDCFPVKDFSVAEILGEKQIAGIGQKKGDITYLWPGCLAFVRMDDIDFSPSHELGLDTGGNLYKVMTEINTLFFNEEHCQNPEFNKSFYNFYSMIHNHTFMHFVNSSNWSNTNDHQERLNSLINILDKL